MRLALTLSEGNNTYNNHGMFHKSIKRKVNFLSTF